MELLIFMTLLCFSSKSNSHLVGSSTKSSNILSLLKQSILFLSDVILCLFSFEFRWLPIILHFHRTVCIFFSCNFTTMVVFSFSWSIILKNKYCISPSVYSSVYSKIIQKIKIYLNCLLEDVTVIIVTVSETEGGKK